MRKQEFNQSLSEKQLISRKEAIRRAGLMMGGFVFAPALTGVLNGCTPQAGEWTPVAFDKDQATTIKAVVDTIFPETDTPSASQAGIPGFIDELLTRNSSEISCSVRVLCTIESEIVLLSGSCGMHATPSNPRARVDRIYFIGKGSKLLSRFCYFFSSSFEQFQRCLHSISFT